MVVVQAVFFAKEIGLSTCILEGDSTKIFNASRSDFDSFASFRHLIPDAKFFAKSFHSVLFSHTQRVILAILLYKITFYPLNNIIDFFFFLSNAIITNFSTTFLQIVEIANSY